MSRAIYVTIAYMEQHEKIERTKIDRSGPQWTEVDQLDPSGGTWTEMDYNVPNRLQLTEVN